MVVAGASTRSAQVGCDHPMSAWLLHGCAARQRSCRFSVNGWPLRPEQAAVPDVRLLSQQVGVLPVVLAGGLRGGVAVLSDCTVCRISGMAGTPDFFTVAAMGRQAKSIVMVNTGQEHPMSLALVTALHHTNSFHHGPWYIAVPILVVALGVAIWRRWRGGGGRGPFGGSGDQ
jgi:hypothetical protein